MILTPVILIFSRRTPSIGEMRPCGNPAPPRGCAVRTEAPAAPAAELRNALLDEVMSHLLAPRMGGRPSVAPGMPLCFLFAGLAGSVLACGNLVEARKHGARVPCGETVQREVGLLHGSGRGAPRTVGPFQPQRWFPARERDLGESKICRFTMGCVRSSV